MADQDVYDFETVIATAVAAFLVAAGITASTQADDPVFQQKRPRTSILFKTGSATIPLQQAGPNQKNIGAYKGQLELTNLTGTEAAAGKLTHAAYKSTVRRIMETGPFLAAINNATLLPYHKIQLIYPAGSTQTFKPEEGFEMSALSYAVDFSLNANAWDNLS